MVHLRVRTEYSFRRAYGKVEEVLRHATGGAMAITDSGTWGHVSWAKACKKAGVRPLFGVELALVPNASLREKQSTATAVLLAKTDAGLRDLYEIVSLANTTQFFYTPRIDYSTINSISDDVVVLLGPGTDLARVSTLKGQHYLMMTPSNRAWNRAAMTSPHFRRVVACDNHYPTLEDAPAYEILAAFNKETRSTPMHILSEDELRLAVPEADDECFLNTERIAAECDAHLPRAENIKIDSPTTLYQQCIDGAKARGLPLVDGGLADRAYQERLKRELDMIQQKQFEDYFFLVGDLVRWAKQQDAGGTRPRIIGRIPRLLPAGHHGRGPVAA
jgi:DNA polymerase-3 subunit alpha